MSIEIVRVEPAKITKAKIEMAWRERAPRRRLVMSDTECRGLALIVNPTSMTWRFEYKPRGTDPHTGKRFPSRSVTIGNPETHSPDDARTEANALKGQAKAGADPAELRRAKISADALRRGRTANRLLEEYAKALPNRGKLRGGTGKLSGRVAKEEVAYVRGAIAAMNAGDRPVTEITAVDLKIMLTAAADRPATAWHWYGSLSRMFDWAQDEGLVTANPCALLAKARRPRPAKPRQSFNTAPQLGALWRAIDAADGLAQVHRDLLHFLILIPCRRTEAAELDWQDVDLAAAIWTQRGTETKNGDRHRFHLPETALGILRIRHEAASRPNRGLVFPSPRANRPIDAFTKLKRAVDDALTEKFKWMLHDHRRSFVTALAEAGTDEALVDSILNHRQSSTRAGALGVYQQAQRWPAQVGAMKQWDQLLRQHL